MAPPSFVDRVFARIGLRARSRLTGSTEGGETSATEAQRREAALWAYRVLLLREPESESTLAGLASAGSMKSMREMILSSAQARALPGYPVTHAMSGNEPLQAVQVEIGTREREELFRLVQGVWQSLGERKAHWSVLTQAAFEPANIGRSLDKFYDSGEHNVATLLRTLERNGIDAARLERCMDFGCGVGRLSLALARKFARVVAVDVSASHLRVAREAVAQRRVENVSFHLLEAIDGADRLPEVDLVYSLIVLQHNPPPVIRALLSALLGRLRPGGVAVIQIPTYMPGNYRFVLSEYAANGGRDMEMHPLPQREVFALVRAAGVELLEVLEDGWTGYGAGSRSNTFVMRRPG